MKANLLKFYSFIDESIDIRKWLRFLTWFLSIFISLYCLILLSLPLYETSAPKGIIFAKNNDGGRAIEVSMITKWYNSNHFAPYGNLYYRLSHTLADLIPLSEKSLPEIETREKSHAFALKVVSLYSLYSLGLFLAYILIGTSPMILLFASFFTLFSMRIEMWSHWVMHPHPEHLLNFFTAIAVYAFAKLLVKPEDRKLFVLSAFAWGLTMAVKRSTAVFVPGIILFLVFPFNKPNAQRTLKFIGLMLFSYLLIGFPQNFGFYKHIKFLLYESSVHTVGGLQNFLHISGLIWQQLWVILIPVIALSFFSKNREKNLSLKFVGFIVLSTLPIYLRELAFEGGHHTMPLTIGLMILVLLAILHFNPFRIKIKKEYLLLPLLLISIKLHGVPDTYIKLKHSELVCREDMIKIIDYLSARVGADRSLVREPFFPSNSEIEKFTFTTWGIMMADINSSVSFLGIQNRSYNEYAGTPPTYFYGKMLADYEEKTRFYQKLRGKNEFTTPDGSSFKKIISVCGFDLWERK